MKHLLFYKTTFENQKGAFPFEYIRQANQTGTARSASHGGVTMCIYICIHTQILTLLYKSS